MSDAAVEQYVGDVSFYVAEQYQVATLLRRSGAADEAFVDGRWQPSGRVRAYEQGFDRRVRPISELEARVLLPAAFSRLEERVPGPASRRRWLGLIRQDPLRRQWDQA